MNGSGLRVLIASPLGGIVAPRFREVFTPGTVTVAAGEHQVRTAIAESLRFDVVLTDLMWNDPDLEDTFDGLDVLDLVVSLGRPAPILFAAQGHSVEDDHLDEAVVRPGVAGFVRKANGVEGFVPVLRQIAAGRPVAPAVVPSTRTSIHTYFGAGRRGETAGRMAGAIASGHAVNYDTLAAAAGCSRNTAIKIADKYLGPLIRERGEHAEHLPLSTQVVYRWCGEHSRYLVSWCRRHGHADVLGGGSGHTRSGTGTARR